MKISKSIKRLLLSQGANPEEVSQEVQKEVNFEITNTEENAEKEDLPIDEDFIIIKDIPEPSEYTFDIQLKDEANKEDLTNNSIDKNMVSSSILIDKNVEIVCTEGGTYEVKSQNTSYTDLDIYNIIANKYKYTIFPGIIIEIENRVFYILENKLPHIYEVIASFDNRLIYKRGINYHYIVTNRFNRTGTVKNYIHIDVKNSYYRLYKSKNSYDLYNSFLLLVSEKSDLNFNGEGYLDEGKRIHISGSRKKIEYEDFSILGKYENILGSESLKSLETKKNPSKIILLISVINLIANKVFGKGKIPVSKVLKDSFENTWYKYFSFNVDIEDYYLPMAIIEMNKEVFWENNVYEEFEMDVVNNKISTFDELQKAVRDIKISNGFHIDLIKYPSETRITLRYLDSIMRNETWDLSVIY